MCLLHLIWQNHNAYQGKNLASIVQIVKFYLWWKVFSVWLSMLIFLNVLYHKFLKIVVNDFIDFACHSCNFTSNISFSYLPILWCKSHIFNTNFNLWILKHLIQNRITYKWLFLKISKGCSIFGYSNNYITISTKVIFLKSQMILEIAKYSVSVTIFNYILIKFYHDKIDSVILFFW